MNNYWALRNTTIENVSLDFASQKEVNVSYAKNEVDVLVKLLAKFVFDDESNFFINMEIFYENLCCDKTMLKQILFKFKRFGKYRYSINRVLQFLRFYNKDDYLYIREAFKNALP